jgi:hypothetical protein
MSLFQQTGLSDTGAVTVTGSVTTTGTSTVTGNVKVTDGTNFLPTGDVVTRSIFTKSTDGTNTQAVEPSPTNAGVTVDIVHYLTEQGVYFLGQDFATGIANGATRDILFVTPSSKTAHCRMIFSTKGANYSMYEAPTTTANGSASILVNRNRVSSNTPLSTMFSGPTVTAVGTLLAVFSLDAANTRSSDYMTQGDQWILKANTKYLIRMASTAGSNVSSVGIYFYEV